jgi:hypothetical protein
MQKAQAAENCHDRAHPRNGALKVPRPFKIKLLEKCKAQ